MNEQGILKLKNLEMSWQQTKVRIGETKLILNDEKLIKKEWNSSYFYGKIEFSEDN